MTAIRSFFRYMSLESPAHSAIIRRVLAIPNQRDPRALVGFLTGRRSKRCWLRRTEVDGWDAAITLFSSAVQTGLRLSEMTALRHEDVALVAGPILVARAKDERNAALP